jgi:hypothetical protein
MVIEELLDALSLSVLWLYNKNHSCVKEMSLLGATIMQQAFEGTVFAVVIY